MVLHSDTANTTAFYTQYSASANEKNRLPGAIVTGYFQSKDSILVYLA